MRDDRLASIAELAANFDHNDHDMRRECAHVYSTLRGACPVFHSQTWGGFWVASRYEDVYEVGRDPERFTSGDGVMVPPMGHGRPLKPMEADAPEHSAYRHLLLPSFAPAQVAKMEADVRALAVSLVDQVVDDGQADLYEMLGKPLPLLMITLLLGIETDDMFWEATDTLMYGRLSDVGEAAILQAADDLYAFMDRQTMQHTRQGRVTCSGTFCSTDNGSGDRWQLSPEPGRRQQAMTGAPPSARTCARSS